MTATTTNRQPKLTSARGAALKVLAVHHPRPCRRTSYGTDVDNRTLYWQSADWLVRNGYARAEVLDGTFDTVVSLTDAGIERAKVEGFRFDPEVHEAQLDGELKAAAADLYRGMNESLSEHLAGLDELQRTEVFAFAEALVAEDVEAGKPLDVLRAFTDAVMHVDPAYSKPNPAEGSDLLTAAEMADRDRWLAAQAAARRVTQKRKEVMPS